LLEMGNTGTISSVLKIRQVCSPELMYALANPGSPARGLEKVYIIGARPSFVMMPAAVRCASAAPRLCPVTKREGSLKEQEAQESIATLKREILLEIYSWRCTTI
jgi:hypothetical protein